MIKHFLSITGDEAMFYNQFLRQFGMREKINDITKPKVFSVGDVELPKNSIYHYTPTLIGEVGPSNTAPFIGNYDGRVNLYFDWEYDHNFNISSIRIRPINKLNIEKNYFKGHFTLFRAKNYTPFLSKERELLVNNLACGRLSADYVRQSAFTLFNQNYNEWLTSINSINRYSEISDREQFIDIRLPKTFPTYNELKNSFNRYMEFFDDKGLPSKLKKEPLSKFQAGKSFWILDLYGFLLGHEYHQYSIFSKLTDKSLEKLSIVFSFNGIVTIAKLSTIRKLVSFYEDENANKISGSRINSFKYFYLRLIGMTTNIDIDLFSKELEDEQTGEKTQEEKELPRGSGDLGDSGDPSRLHDNNDDSEGFDGLFPDSKGKEGGEDQKHVKEGGGAISGSGTEPVESSTYKLGDESDEPEPSTKFGDEIPDEIFEQLSSETTAIQRSRSYTPTASIERELDERAKAGKLTTKQKDYFLTVSQSYKDIEIGGRTIEEIIDIKDSDMKIDNIDLISDDITLIDKSAKKSRAFMLGKGYREKMLDRNIIEMIVYSQNSGIAITNIEKETIITADSKYDVYKMQYQPIDGNASTRYIRIPKVDDDGTFMINGVKSYAQFVRMEKPIRKVSPIAVQLTSYYDKPRIRIERSKLVVNNYSRWLKIRIIERSTAAPEFKIILGNNKSEKEQVCYYYSILAERFKYISFNGFEFQFNTSELIGNDKEADKLCNGDTWIIGRKEGHWVLIDSTGYISVNGQGFGYIEEILGIDISKAPIPVSTININGYKFPSIVVLSYWIGFSNLLEMTGAKYRSVDPNIREKLLADEYSVTLADEKLIFNRRDELTTLIVSGLKKINGISNFTRMHLDDPNIWFGLMDDSRVKASHFKEMSLMYKMFIDPITSRLLKKDGYPTQLDLLCIEGIKLLLNNESKSETAITEQRFVGYERFAGHIYRENCKAARQYHNKPNTGKRTFDLNPESVMLNIITDSSVQAVEEVNPIHQNKQQEEVTFGGTMGRSEVAMVRRTRGMQQDYTGIISEAGKDSSKIGFVSYLTSDPKIVDYYGNVDVTEPATSTGMGSVTMNLLYGGTHDDQNC